MNDSHDPYNTPPAPERFSNPQGDPLESFQSQHVPPRDLPPANESVRLESSEPPGPPFGTSTDDDRLSLGAPLPALEPLPAMAGNFSAPQTQSAGDHPSLANRLVDEFVAWLKTLASAAVYATLIVTFGFQVARVEGQSMAPTLEDQDRLIVNKFAYLSAVGEPKPNDIVMLYYPNNPDKSFVKRIIAAENETVRIVDGKVFVKCATCNEERAVDDSFVPSEYRSHEDWGPQVVPEGYYFVMGDHRNNSSDSRHWGWVPKKYIIGRVQLRWWPVPQARTF